MQNSSVSPGVLELSEIDLQSIFGGQAFTLIGIGGQASRIVDIDVSVLMDHDLQPPSAESRARARARQNLERLKTRNRVTLRKLDPGTRSA